MCISQTLESVSSQYQASYMEAEAQYNANKNRYPDKLPSKSFSVACVNSYCMHYP